MGLKRGRQIVYESSEEEEEEEDNNSKLAKRTGGKNCNMKCFSLTILL